MEQLKLRDYQIDIAHKAISILLDKRIVYISSEVRTGKTLMALETIRLLQQEKGDEMKALFLTKKKAIKSITDDYVNFGYDKYFELTVTNNESMHKVIGEYGVIVHDESHRFGSFPKPSKYAKDFKMLYGNLPLILLSGTPTPESYSQIYHQFWVSLNSPFKHSTFYKWAHEYVTITQKNLGYGMVNDYSKANNQMIQEVINPYMVTFTQKQAGFTTEVKETVLHCKLKTSTYKLIDTLKKDLVIQGKEESITADTAVKLMQKVHQLYSGTIKFDSGNKKVLDHSKAEYIKEMFADRKIAIFYKFTEELQAIKDVFGDNLTVDLEEFNNSHKSFAVQIVSGREGISLKEADYLVYYNIDFSATSYWQSRDRLTTMDRLSNDIFYIFAENGIEDKIFKSVKSKKSYTTSYFKRHYGIEIPRESKETV